MPQKIVSTQAQLLSALSSAKGGDTIILKDGSYGSVTLTRDYASQVSIVAENTGGALFDKIEVKGGSNIAIDGVESRGEIRAWYYAEDITITNSKAGQFYFRFVDGLKIDHSEGADGHFGLILNSVQNFSVTNSYFHGATEDVARITGNSYNGLLENNFFGDAVSKYPLHPDLLQLFGANGITPHDIVIRGNLFWDDPSTGSVNAQGIFMADPRSAEGYKNILIEENLIASRHPNTIYVGGGQENVVIRNNTLLSDANNNGGGIRLAEDRNGFDNSGTIIYGNALKSIYDETKSSTIGDNFTYGRTDPAKIFQGNDGSSWENFLPREGSQADFGSGYGAQARLKQLLAGDDDLGAEPPEALPPEAGPELVFGLDGTRTFSGRIDGRVKKIADDDKFDLGEGTIAFDFKADTIGKGGLVSKDASGKGSHFEVWIDNGTLKIMAGDADGGTEQTISVAGIKAKATYEFVASFDEDSTTVWLDGKQVGEIDGHMDWHENDEVLMLGAENSRSASGSTAGARYAYDGKITDFAIYDHAMTADELQAHLASQTLV